LTGSGKVVKFAVQSCAVKRRYELKARAARQAATRRRIVEAAVGLHTSVGPAATTISAIAERAGVQRHTVYAHFPDESTLFGACSAHWTAANPFPDPTPWLAEVDAEVRLRAALSAVYEWYERVEAALTLFARDADAVPSNLRDARDAQMARLADGLAHGLPRRKLVRAAVGHALAFETWRSLVRQQGLSRRDAVAAMVQLVMTV
jgi:AcrR family transcriptional regulator